ncbi:hypothetical protein FSARC_10588 [Fusarium sarcochroum]|uniref:Uncharacterized protein n=1 Tax=Fusarium sarcochroum TaxID=1208366 RepID=A0A8H4TLC9_9HYPO|nr:hypothetical protein FSARC_10588 [Fusarium sarcochroum]
MDSFSVVSPIRRKPVPRPEEVESSLSGDFTPLEDMRSESAYFPVQQHDDAQAMAPKTYTNEAERVPPRVLKTRSEKVLLALVDISLFACSILFLVLAVSAARLDNTTESQYGRTMMNLSDLGPTIFPVVFTTIVARLMKSMAYYLAEKGTKLRLLEETRLIHYLDVNARSYFGEASHYMGMDSVISSIFMASVIASNSTKASPVDPWNNPKVPTQKATQPDSHGIYPWVPVTANDSMDYLSLIGLRLWNIPETGRTEFVMESSYLKPTCSKQPPLKEDEWNKRHFPNSTFAARMDWDGYNETSGDPYSGENYIDIQFAIYSIQDNYTGFVYNCTLRSTSLDLHLICDGGDCKVNRTRTISPSKRPDWEVPWNIIPGCIDWPARHLGATLYMMTTAAGTTMRGYTTPVEPFLKGSSPFTIEEYISFENVTDIDFSIRFGQLLNAIYLSTQLFGDIAGSIHEHQPETLETSKRCRMYTNTTATVFQEQKVYEALPIWIAFLILACVFLLICCFMTFYIHQWVFLYGWVGKGKSGWGCQRPVWGYRTARKSWEASISYFRVFGRSDGSYNE